MWFIATELDAAHEAPEGPASWTARCFVQRLSQNATEPVAQRKRHVNSGR
jgi:hypothetical protein